ncbi:hypothetical protein MNEG_1539 [Monoraphidium neglectum]|uniref:mTERF domain-containing protein n=1 Tax=Monoraphidium neglectum TaxID=145388 RepID=A0A0D2N1K1_9CHLO|nr:hypothetical protein MNEG_1539 [Monoraphidium neglectum]KIZ06407.1 hypothetical protein MNEG_1539 [Monoraphidium neglectum]|eukprot:XP_013905426.1 hypothetical protein MNEG_1539 [Monoraphidium neglectum]
MNTCLPARLPGARPLGTSNCNWVRRRAHPICSAKRRAAKKADGSDTTNDGAATGTSDGAASADASPKRRAPPRAPGAKKQVPPGQQTFAAQLSEALGPGITAADAAAAVRTCSVTRLDQWPAQVLAANAASLWELTECSSRTERARAVRTAPELLTLPKGAQREMIMELGRFFNTANEEPFWQLRAGSEAFRRYPRAALVHPSALQARCEEAVRALARGLAARGAGGRASSERTIKHMLQQHPALLELPEGVLKQRVEALQKLDMPVVWMQRMLLTAPQLLLIEPRTLIAKIALLQVGLGGDFLMNLPDPTIGRLAGYSATRLARYPFLKRAKKLPGEGARASSGGSDGAPAVPAWSDARFGKDHPGFAEWLASNREQLEREYAPLTFPPPAGSRRGRSDSTNGLGVDLEDATGDGSAGEGSAGEGATSSWPAAARGREEGGSGDDGESEASEGEGEGSVDVANDELPQIGSAMWV